MGVLLFAFIPAGLSGANWFWQLSIMVGLLTGILSLVAPLLIMQPSFGFGIAAALNGKNKPIRFLNFCIRDLEEIEIRDTL